VSASDEMAMSSDGVAANTAGYTAERIARNDAIFREANEGIRDAAQEYDLEGRIPFVCECADPNCRELLRLTLDDYRQIRSDPRHFLNVPGHEAAAQGWGEVIARNDQYVTVRKLGRAGDIAEQLEGEQDPAAAPLAERDPQP
jgi:hypothetical protein